MIKRSLILDLKNVVINILTERLVKNIFWITKLYVEISPFSVQLLQFTICSTKFYNLHN